MLTLEKLSLEDGMDRMIRRAARIKWRDVLEMAQEQMSPADMNLYLTTIGKDDESIDHWIDNAIEPGAIKWLIDLSDGDGRAKVQERGSQCVGRSGWNPQGADMLLVILRW